MQLNEIKELYATGEWICVFFTPMGMKWGKLHNPTFHVKIGSNAYKLIHKKHSDVLTHYLEGGEVKYYHLDAKEWCKDPNFIDDYDPSYSYKINNVVVEGSLEHGKVYTADGLLDYEAYAETRCRPKPKLVKRITRVEAQEKIEEFCFLAISDATSIKDWLFDYIEYLEANQKTDK